MDLTPERKLERQVLLLALAHPRAGVESDRLHKILHHETTNPIAELVDATWSLKHRGLLNTAPEPDDPDGGLCAYTLTAADEVLVWLGARLDRRGRGPLGEPLPPNRFQQLRVVALPRDSRSA